MNIETGSVKGAKEYDFDGDFSWDQYFKDMYGGLINEEKITEFEKTYHNSDEEKKDVLNAYTESKGDLEYILDNVPLCTSKDYPRFIEIIEMAIKEKQVKKYRKFNTKNYKQAMKAREKKEEKERKEFEKQQEKEKNEKDEEKDTKSLALLIQENRKRRMDSTIDHLMEKYANNSTSNKKRKQSISTKKGKGSQQQQRKGKKSKIIEEPSEEEFLKLQEKLFGKRK